MNEWWLGFVFVCVLLSSYQRFNSMFELGSYSIVFHWCQEFLIQLRFGNGMNALEMEWVYSFRPKILWKWNECKCIHSLHTFFRFSFFWEGLSLPPHWFSLFEYFLYASEFQSLAYVRFSMKKNLRTFQRFIFLTLVFSNLFIEKNVE